LLLLLLLWLLLLLLLLSSSMMVTTPIIRVYEFLCYMPPPFIMTHSLHSLQSHMLHHAILQCVVVRCMEML
jgi:hypothetical protein